MRRTALALAMVLSMMLAGCFGDGSETITNDGGVVVAYHDSTDPDPLFAVELELPA